MEERITQLANFPEETRELSYQEIECNSGMVAFVMIVSFAFFVMTGLIIAAIVFVCK